VIDGPLAPLLHVYVYGAEPPVAPALKVPFAVPTHDSGVLTKFGNARAVGCAMVTLIVVSHPKASEITTEYGPAARPVAVAVLCWEGSFHV
jgi:hypothetical protein